MSTKISPFNKCEPLGNYPSDYVTRIKFKTNPIAVILHMAWMGQVSKWSRSNWDQFNVNGPGATSEIFDFGALDKGENLVMADIPIFADWRTIPKRADDISSNLFESLPISSTGILSTSGNGRLGEPVEICYGGVNYKNTSQFIAATSITVTSDAYKKWILTYDENQVLRERLDYDDYSPYNTYMTLLSKNDISQAASDYAEEMLTDYELGFATTEFQSQVGTRGWCGDGTIYEPTYYNKLKIAMHQIRNNELDANLLPLVLRTICIYEYKKFLKNLAVENMFNSVPLTYTDGFNSSNGTVSSNGTLPFSQINTPCSSFKPISINGPTAADKKVATTVFKDQKTGFMVVISTPNLMSNLVISMMKMVSGGDYHNKIGISIDPQSTKIRYDFETGFGYLAVQGNDISLINLNGETVK